MITKSGQNDTGREAAGPTATAYDLKKGFLNGIRVLQYTDEEGDYAGRPLAGLGADVVMGHELGDVT